MTLTIDRMQMKMTSPQGIGLDYDSASEKPPEGMAKLLWRRMFEAMVKKPFSMKIDSQGKVTDMKLPQGFVETLNKMGGGQMEEHLQRGGDQADGRGRSCCRRKRSPREIRGPARLGRNAHARKDEHKTKLRYEGTENRDGKELDKIAAPSRWTSSPRRTTRRASR